jgi:hypothetical protein
MYARTYEQWNHLSPTTTTSQNWSAGRSAIQSVKAATLSTNASSPATASAASSTGKSTTKRLSPVEITERQHKGQCFMCDELYTPGHRDVCKQLYMIEIIFDSDYTTPPVDDNEMTPTISLHALMGI